MESAGDRPPLLMLGAPPRGGNHLLRGLLDGHPDLLLPPDEDYFVRHLARSLPQRLMGMLASPASVPDYSRQLQKVGQLERINAGRGSEVFGTEGSLDLDIYYRYLRQHHRRGSVDSLVRNHVEAMALALGHRPGDGRQRVYFCALQPSNRDLTRVSRLLARSYTVRGLFVIRDPRAQLASKLMRNPGLSPRRFCIRQNRYLEEIDRFEQERGPCLRVRFEELIIDTEATMRRVCELAGIPFLPQVLDYTQGGEPSQSNSSFAASDGIDAGALSRYREILPAETAAYLERHCREELFWHEGSGAL